MTVSLDVGVGLVGGLVATEVTEYAQQALLAATPDEMHRREQQVRPGLPFRVAAEKSVEIAAVDRGEQGTMAAGMVSGMPRGLLWSDLLRHAPGRGDGVARSERRGGHPR